jgi:dTDP-D-glucose 4,6-dehydratase
VRPIQRFPRMKSRVIIIAAGGLGAAVMREYRKKFDMVSFNHAQQNGGCRSCKDVLKRLGKPESFISFVIDRLGHGRRYAIDSSRALSVNCGGNHCLDARDVIELQS